MKRKWVSAIQMNLPQKILFQNLQFNSPKSGQLNHEHQSSRSSSFGTAQLGRVFENPSA